MTVRATLHTTFFAASRSRVQMLENKLTIVRGNVATGFIPQPPERDHRSLNEAAKFPECCQCH